MNVTRPRPLPDPISQPFWDAAKVAKLAIQRCTTCRTFQHPPRPLCRACSGTDLAFEPVSGQGTLWSWTVTRHGVLSGFEPALPYTCMIIELIEQPGLFVTSDLVGRETLREHLAIGAKMQLCFPQADPLLPQFEPVSS